MNWEAAGAIGEIVGAAGVIATLVYLAVQIRQNTKSVRAAAVWDSQMSFVAINETLAGGGRISEVMYRAIADPGSLDAFEKHLAQRFLRSFLQRMEAQFALYQKGILDVELWKLRCGYAQGVLAYPLPQEIWALEKQNSMFTNAFVEAIEQAPHHELGGFLGIQKPGPGAAPVK